MLKRDDLAIDSLEGAGGVAGVGKAVPRRAAGCDKTCDGEGVGDRDRDRVGDGNRGLSNKIHISSRSSFRASRRANFDVVENGVHESRRASNFSCTSELLF